MVSSATFGDAVAFGVQDISLAGPVLRKEFRVEGNKAIFDGYDVMALGAPLPLASEFWFTSLQTLISLVLERHPSKPNYWCCRTPPPCTQSVMKKFCAVRCSLTPT